jgi:L-threonylcarbamoyladenylate synthase
MSELFTRNDLSTVIDLMKNDKKVIAMPTDTVFGIGCVYDDLLSLERIKQIKHRDPRKALPMMCSNLEMIERIAILNDDDRRLVKAMGKGAITYIFRLREEIDRTITNGLDTIAIRIPDDDFIIGLIEGINKPLLVTSMNISNEPSIRYASEVIAKFSDQVDIIINEDALSTMSSTIYDTINHRILRQGAIDLKTIEEKGSLHG